MNRSWQIVALVAVAVAFVALVAWRETYAGAPASRIEPEDSAVGRVHPRVLLFADPREAGASCGCGLIVHAVREAAAAGVATREVDPQRARDLVARYRVSVEPTVIFLDEQGHEVSRHEGEGGETIASIEAELDRLGAR